MDRRVTAGFYPQLRLDGRGRIVAANVAAGELIDYFAVADPLLEAVASARRDGARSVDVVTQGRIFCFAIQPTESGVELFGREVTEEREAAATLRQERARLQALLEAAPDAIVTVNDLGRIDYINPRGAAVFGWEAAALIGRPVEVLIPDWQRNPAVAGALGLNAGPGDSGRTGLRADGERFPVELSASLLDRDGRSYVTAIVRDVTEREAAAREIRALNRHLERHVEELTGLNAELESFSYSVSHDLRGPLRSIDGFSAILLEDYGESLDEEGRGYLHRVRAATTRMADLIEGLLRLSRITRTELHRERVDLGAVAAFVIDGLRRESPGREVAVAIAPGLEAEGDRALLTVALENLLGNAWKFTARTPAARIDVGRDAEGFYVRDNGAGFDMAFANKLFVPFERLHGAGEFPGTGIGLATVARIIRRHGGRIRAEGAPGRGAVFRFTLPP